MIVSHPANHSQVKPRQRVLLIGWDGADWQHINPLLDAGKMPTLERLVNHGVMGNLATMQPVLSPMLWNTIATGKTPDHHGICGFMEPDPVNGGSRPITSLSRKGKAIWNIFSQSGLTSNVVGWWASHPAEPIRGTVVSPSFRFAQRKEEGIHMPSGTIHPASRAQEFSSPLVTAAELLPEDLFPFVPKLLEASPSHRSLIQVLGKLIAECSTIQATATQLLENDDWDLTAVYFDTIDHACHAFMPFFPPRMPSVSETDFEIFREVIDGFYQFHDMMLSRLWQLAGPDTLVVLCSDHGFESGSGRPMMVSNEPAGPADWHREFGILAIAGPGVKQDERVYGANLIDITPTILAHVGLPIGEDMQGRPLASIFDRPIEIGTIPSWDQLEGVHDPGLHPPGNELKIQPLDDLRQQFVALGYVEDHGTDLKKASDDAQVELDFNLSRVYLSTDRSDSAIPILEELLHQRPWELRFIANLAHSYFQSGYLRQCLELLSQAFTDQSITVPMRLLKGRALFAAGKTHQALETMERVAQSNPRVPQIQIYLGRAFLKQGELKNAKAAFVQAIAINPEKALAYEGLASVFIKQRDYESAAESALDALALLHHLPKSHYLLGVALMKLEDYPRAIQAFKTASHIAPRKPKPHQQLYRIYQRFLDDPVQADFHFRKYQELRTAISKERQQSSNRGYQSFKLPKIPDAESRRALLDKHRPNRKDQQKSGRTLTLVSGLPRSGTSLMMQLLEAGGIPPMTDELRVADSDNPRGYYEWEQIKQLPTDPSLLDDNQLDHKVIKVISMLLGSLPTRHHYRVIYLTRDPVEVAASQQKMIHRLGTEGGSHSTQKLVQSLADHSAKVQQILHESPNCELLVIDYRQLIEMSSETIDSIADFLGDSWDLSKDQMKNVIDPSLYRQRSSRLHSNSAGATD